MNNEYNPEDIEIKYLVPNEIKMDMLALTDHVRDTLRDVYKSLTMVLGCPDLYDNPVECVEGLEYTLQILWGFTPDRNYHSYWNKLKGCTCSDSDNRDMMGTKDRWYSSDCPFHGIKEEI